MKLRRSDGRSPVVKRSIAVRGRKTSVTLEEPFWESLREISALKRETVSSLVGSLDEARDHSNLSSAIRVFVLSHYRGADEHHAEIEVQNEVIQDVHSSAIKRDRHRGRPPRFRASRSLQNQLERKRRLLRRPVLEE